jgi:hypothetical protein
VRDSKESIVLVHYFDELNKDAAGRQSSSSVNYNASKGVKRSLPAVKATMQPFRQPSPLKPQSSEDTVESIMKSRLLVCILPQLYSGLTVHPDRFTFLAFRLFRYGL